jgi:MYXO-CTERM domain-containing protein
MRVDRNAVRCTGADCNSATASVVAGDEWIGDARTCPGDSGGPALDKDGQVMGVLSRGPEGCTASVYTDVTSWKPLIVQTAIEAGESGGFDPPAWTGVLPKPKLGQSCTGPCAAGYLCLTNDPSVPGICVPPCSVQVPTCPSGYHCDTTVNACSNLASPDKESSGGGSSGCSVQSAPTPLGASGSLGALLGALALVSRRRSRR